MEICSGILVASFSLPRGWSRYGPYGGGWLVAAEPFQR